MRSEVQRIQRLFRRHILTDWFVQGWTLCLAEFLVERLKDEVGSEDSGLQGCLPEPRREKRDSALNLGNRLDFLAQFHIDVCQSHFEHQALLSALSCR
jgi:hypothetical protein